MNTRRGLGALFLAFGVTALGVLVIAVLGAVLVVQGVAQ